MSEIEKPKPKPRGKKIVPAKLRGALAAGEVHKAKARAKRAAYPRKRRPAPPKYKNSGLHINGMWFASKAEGMRYEQLLALEAEGKIENLECQVRFDVRVNNKLCCFYLADFRYTVLDELGRPLRRPVEDVKGMRTPLFVLKAKLVEASHDIEIVEIPAGKVKQWEGRTS